MRDIILVDDKNVMLLSYKIIFIKNKVKYIRKYETITVDR